MNQFSESAPRRYAFADQERAKPDVSDVLPPPSVLRRDEALDLMTSLGEAGAVRSPVLLIAASAGEGTSTMARDLAIVAASDMNARVLLLDLDPPGVRQATWFDQRTQADDGSASAALALRARSGWSADVQRLANAMAFRSYGRERLCINTRLLPPLPDPSYWRAVLGVLGGTFDLVVIDCPPLDRSPMGIALAPFAAANVIVARAEFTPATVVRRLRDRLAEAGGSLAGCILNRRRLRLPAMLDGPSG